MGPLQDQPSAAAAADSGPGEEGVPPTVAQQPIGVFAEALAAKQSTPGGGAAAAIGAVIGASAAAMAAAYSQRKKDVESGAAAKAAALIAELDLVALLSTADADAAAYADLQRTWKDKAMSAEEKAKIEATALAVPVSLVEICHRHVTAIMAFLPDCNPNITSDAKVGIHQLAGAARAAFQTVLVNNPPPDLRNRLKGLLREMSAVEATLLDLDSDKDEGSGSEASM